MTVHSIYTDIIFQLVFDARRGRQSYERLIINTADAVTVHELRSCKRLQGIPYKQAATSGLERLWTQGGLYSRQLRSSTSQNISDEYGYNDITITSTCPLSRLPHDDETHLQKGVRILERG